MFTFPERSAGSPVPQQWHEGKGVGALTQIQTRATTLICGLQGPHHADPGEGWARSERSKQSISVFYQSVGEEASIDHETSSKVRLTVDTSSQLDGLGLCHRLEARRRHPLCAHFRPCFDYKRMLFVLALRLSSVYRFIQNGNVFLCRCRGGTNFDGIKEEKQVEVKSAVAWRKSKQFKKYFLKNNNLYCIVSLTKINK